MTKKPARADARPWKVGDSGWEVEWCSKRGWVDESDPSLGTDPDLDTLHTNDFRTREEAWQFAVEIYAKDQYGAVRVTPFRLVPLSDEPPYGIHREYTADSSFYEGETEGRSA